MEREGQQKKEKKKERKRRREKEKGSTERCAENTTSPPLATCSPLCLTLVLPGLAGPAARPSGHCCCSECGSSDGHGRDGSHSRAPLSNRGGSRGVIQEGGGAHLQAGGWGMEDGCRGL